VQSVAEKALDAIRDNDATFLSRLADPGGVYVGTDAQRMSALRFGRELLEKRGVYCVIFDASCLKGQSVDSRTRYSLRQILIQQQVTMNVTRVGGAPEVRAAVVKKVKGSNEILFTLVFRHVEGNWKLQQIEYE
jgi:hypothetical protein